MIMQIKRRFLYAAVGIATAALFAAAVVLYAADGAPYSVSLHNPVAFPVDI